MHKGHKRVQSGRDRELEKLLRRAAALPKVQSADGKKEHEDPMVYKLSVHGFASQLDTLGFPHAIVVDRELQSRLKFPPCVPY